MSASADTEAPIFGPEFQAELNALFRWRRDVRRFRRDALPVGLLDQLLATANGAPSVGLSQPWRFVTVEDPARRAAVRADFAACNAAALTTQDETRAATYARLKLAGLEQAPCQVAVFIEPDPSQGHGLGLGWVSILDPSGIRSILDVPETWRLVAYLCIGYPEIDAMSPELEREGWETRRSISVLMR
ncbi:hypothetical protein HMP09_3152 [Sphingomonas sp. HMP9]|uniref:nitroreductase family protein n=1 Tax=Sphingomonas sp. HMP9 TaxID=1517554 RepID=UPI00159655A0|nr:nitroreductase family protein [Sphingomonas sp. HMP9]BCA63918.1 hypothetical protein HMP09_3152 [Sphingomonas sp. HMP9]